jgi:hypothetical protein
MIPSHVPHVPSAPYAVPIARPGAHSPSACSFCGQPFAPDEDHLVQMRDGTAVAAFHDRCNPHYRRSGCGRC